MDFDRIREFSTFAGSMEFTQAARDLHLSQSALSRHIKEMEAELGVDLVQRGTLGSPNVLTPAGKRFLVLSDRLLDDYDAIVRECRSLNNDVAPARIQDVQWHVRANFRIKQLLEQAGLPVGNFTYVETSLPLYKALDTRELDFGLRVEADPAVPVPPPEDLETYGAFSLAPEPLYCLVSQSNPLAGRGSLTREDLDGHRIITIAESLFTNWNRTVETLLGGPGRRSPFRVVDDLPRRGNAFPIGGSDVCVCTRRFASYYQGLDVEDVACVPLEGGSLRVYPYLVYRCDNDSTAARRIIEAARNEGRERA